MNYRRAKVYFDGSHYIAIPNVEQKTKKKNTPKGTNAQELKVREILQQNKDKPKREKISTTIETINNEIQDMEKSKMLVNSVLEKEYRNRIVRLTRLYRKAYLQEWNYFCTFTYDSNKMNEDEFREKLLNCLRHFTNRKGWKYIAVFERSPEKDRLHFHCLLYIPNMIGEFIEVKDYSTQEHKMQTTIQNSFFLEKFGRNDFQKIYDTKDTASSIQYMLKYINKTNEKIIYSRHLPTYFITDILETDVICTIGQEDRKLLLFDDFLCMDLDTGEILGNVSKEVIASLPKSN